MAKTICFDLRPLQIGHENRGIGMVIRSILENLTDDENTYLFYTFDSSDPIKKNKISLGIQKYQIITTPQVKTSVKRPLDILSTSKLAYHRYKNLKQYQPDVFIQFDFALGLPSWRGVKTYLYAYDLIPLIMQREYIPTPWFALNNALGKKAKVKAFLRAAYYRNRYRHFYNNYKKADKIISISQATTKSFHELLKIKSKKLITIPLAPVSTTTEQDPSILKKVSKPYLFYLGGTDSRKRVDHIIHAFNIVRGRGYDLQLVLAGNEFRGRKTIPDNRTRDAVNLSPYRDDMRFLGFISDAEKNTLYGNAHAFIFTSLFEGFGLPVIEALSHSCPIVAYNNSSIPEAAGENIHLVTSGNYAAAAERIIELFDTSIRTKEVAEGLRHSRQFTWDKYIEDFKKSILS